MQYVRRVAILLVGALAVVGLAGCGVRSGATRARAAASPGGCTDTWTGRDGDADYEDPVNWSGAHVPAANDFACIPPGSLVKVHQAPIEPATSLVIEGTLCADVGLTQLAGSITNGTPRGQKPLPPLPGSTLLAPPCPSGTGLSFQGTTVSPHPRAPRQAATAPRARTNRKGPTHDTQPRPTTTTPSSPSLSTQTMPQSATTSTDAGVPVA